MPNWSPNDLRTHLLRAKDAGWVEYFDRIGKKTGVSRATLMAIASRETGMQNIITNDGHNHGVMGLDDHEHWKWLQTNDNGMDPATCIEYAAEVLKGFLQYYK